MDVRMNTGRTGDEGPAHSMRCSTGEREGPSSAIQSVFLCAFSAFRVHGLTCVYRCLACLATTVLLGCASTTSRFDIPVPLVLGEFTDDYNAAHILTQREWRHGTKSRYSIVKWNAREQYFIARNDSLNPTDGRLWSRVDWFVLDGMAPWTWAYCMSAFKAPTADAAESTRVANRSTPRTGCNGFPFTRMRTRP